jgi:ElaB/YqjD/DUF883 family membrane-anchored ribosome-binding protein
MWRRREPRGRDLDADRSACGRRGVRRERRRENRRSRGTRICEKPLSARNAREESAMASGRGDELQQDLASLKEDLSGLATHLTAAFTEVGGDVSDDVRRRLQKLGGDVDRVVSQASAKGKDVARSMSPEHFGGTLESAMRDYPFTTLAIAAGVGAFVGSCLHR